MSSTPTRSAAAEMLIVSPISSRGPLSSARRRHITPSSEASSAKSTAVITSPGAIEASQINADRSAFPNPLGWPAFAQQAQIDTRLSIPTPLLQPEQLLPPPRHITLPFDLRADRGALRQEENRIKLGSIFPGTLGFGTDGFFLQFNVETMPPKPWPKTVAGLPIYVGQAVGPVPKHSPMPYTAPATRKNGSIAMDINGQDLKDWKPLFILVQNHFQSVGIAITEVMYLGTAFIIVLEHRNADHTKLPWKVANVSCLYMFESETGRPSAPQARRLTDPTPGNPDHSNYETLQPGVRVASTNLPSDPGKFLSTSAGVLVRDQAGNEFMTVASHGFPGECGTQVIHPLPSIGRTIGELMMEVSHTDVALVKLLDGESFSNVTFCNDEMPEPIQLQRLIRAEDGKRGELIALDSPDTGLCEGVFMWPAFQRIPTDDELTPEQHWIMAQWYYMGQESSSTLPEGMYGSTIWNADGDVLGLFRYAPKEGAMKDWCVGTAADELIDRGFTLVNTTHRQS